MDNLWHYLSNTFLVITENSTKLMMILSPDFRARLQAENADPDILAMLNFFIPIDDALSAAFQSWTSAGAFYKGATLAFELLLKELVDVKLDLWVPQVQVVFPESTPQYLTLFPNGRSPYSSGPYDIRINTVKSLGDNLVVYPALAATKTDVDNFHTTLLSTRAEQQQKEGIVRTKSDLLEVERVNTAVAMYATLGKLMAKFASNPSQIDRFFDLSLIQNPPNDKDTYAVIVAGGDTVNVVEDIEDTTQFKLFNTGDTAGRFFTSTSATGTSEPGEGIELAPNTNTTVVATDLGEPGNTFLNVTNLDPTNQGKYSVVIL
jgi:hypothetical protein